MSILNLITSDKKSDTNSFSLWKPNKYTLAALSTGLFVATPSLVTAQSSTPIDVFETEVLKLSDIYDVLVPVAVGAMVFSMGALLAKRIVFA